ncbi:hypothetical protein FQZ97_1210120 [compost metagenome]
MLPRPSANLPVSTCVSTVSGWFRYCAGAITLAMSSRFFGSRAMADAVSTERTSAAKVLGFFSMNSAEVPKAQQGWPFHRSRVSRCRKPISSNTARWLKGSGPR